jgi:hypothetical protein
VALKMTHQVRLAAHMAAEEVELTTLAYMAPETAAVELFVLSGGPL